MNKGTFSHFTYIRKLEGINIPFDFEKTLKQQHYQQVSIYDSERSLLNSFIGIIFIHLKYLYIRKNINI